ncbi:MAG: lipoyl(octanoyl) transferase LipB [Anaerolineae bacterium]|nr:lipoyl(octanoyl) transferase LipB [Anaerolineae bacterium]
MNASCEIKWLGQVDYGQTLELQKELIAKRLANQIPDTVLLLEHPPTYTIGVDGHRQHLLISEQEFARMDLACYRVNRGGGIFYHSPGQLVVYPILKLSRNCCNYHDYISLLESVIIHALAMLKVRAFRQQGQRGIWVFAGNVPAPGSGQLDSSVAKISSIGVHITRDNISSHGFWINVNPNLQYFDLIVPGGVKDRLVTSLQHIFQKPVQIGTVIKPVIQSFCEIFELEPVTVTPEPALARGQGPVREALTLRPDDKFN